jgi:hypothetical protein
MRRLTVGHPVIGGLSFAQSTTYGGSNASVASSIDPSGRGRGRDATAMRPIAGPGFGCAKAQRFSETKLTKPIAPP